MDEGADMSMDEATQRLLKTMLVEAMYNKALAPPPGVCFALITSDGKCWQLESVEEDPVDGRGLVFRLRDHVGIGEIKTGSAQFAMGVFGEPPVPAVDVVLHQVIVASGIPGIVKGRQASGLAAS